MRLNNRSSIVKGSPSCQVAFPVMVYSQTAPYGSPLATMAGSLTGTALVCVTRFPTTWKSLPTHCGLSYTSP